MHVPLVPIYLSFYLTVLEPTGDALKNVVRENRWLTIRTEWHVAHDSLEKNRPEKDAVP